MPRRPSKPKPKREALPEVLPCLAPCGGEIVLVDRGAEAAEDRFVVSHRPGGGQVTTGSEKTARILMKALAEGKDSRGVLPKAEVRSEEGEVKKPRERALQPPPPPPSSLASACARASNLPVEKIMRTPEANSMALQTILETKFSEDDIVDGIRGLLEAERSFEQNGVLVTTPDHAAREKGLRLLMEFRHGKPLNRPEPKAGKTVDLAAFREKVMRSPAFRETLMKICREADAAAKAKEEVKKG